MPKTIVILDDDLDDLEMMRYVLKKSDPNIYCVTFNNPVDVIKELCTEGSVVPNYIFIDLNMPMMLGSECLSILRMIARLDDTPLIMFSTSMPDDVANSLKRSGATFTFQKPTSLSGYMEILASLKIK